MRKVVAVGQGEMGEVGVEGLVRLGLQLGEGLVGVWVVRSWGDGWACLEMIL